MIVYQYEDQDYGWVTHLSIDSVLESIKVDLESEAEFPGLLPGELKFAIKILEMSQEEIDALEEV